MSEWTALPEMRELESRLLDLGAALDYPPTPALAPRVRSRIAAAPAPSPRLGGLLLQPWRHRLAAALAVAALLLAVVLGVPPVRTTVAHWLGIRGVEITPVQTLPPIPTHSPLPSETPALPGDPLGLGVPSTLQQAQSRLGFAPLLPAELGPPDAVWLRDEDGGVATLVWLPRPGLPASGSTGIGLLLTEFRATTDGRLFEKFVDPQTTVLPISVDGEPGYWISGAPHALGYTLPDGSVVVQSLRLAGNTLLLQHGAISLRIEADLDRAAAQRIAASLR